MNRTRVDALRARMRETGTDLVCLVPGPSLFYFTGVIMEPSERATLLVFPVDEQPLLVAPTLEASRLASAMELDHVFSYPDGGSPGAALRASLDVLGQPPGAVGVEFGHMRLLEAACWDEALPSARLRDAGPALASLRTLKDRDEVVAIEGAVEVTEKALSSALNLIMPGVREGEIQRAVATALLDQGAEDFFVMVSSGPRSAQPHSGTGNRVLQSGDLVWIDAGARRGGYWADITRTFPVDRVDGELAEIYYIVYEAQREARRLVRPYMTCGEVDNICRRYIDARGYGRWFIHRTGHGLGIEVHEPPYIVAGSSQPLEPGMVFTIEPGIYLPDRGGVRIEDDILVTANGCRSLTAFERNFIL